MTLKILITYTRSFYKILQKNNIKIKFELFKLKVFSIKNKIHIKYNPWLIQRNNIYTKESFTKMAKAIKEHYKCTNTINYVSEVRMIQSIILDRINVSFKQVRGKCIRDFEMDAVTTITLKLLEEYNVRLLHNNLTYNYRKRKIAQYCDQILEAL